MELTHLSLNTGQATRTGRAAEPEELLEALQPVLADQAGPLPLFEGWFVDLRPRQNEGETAGAYFQIAEQPAPCRTPAIMAVACWTEPASSECWDQVDGIYRALQGELVPLRLWRPPPRRAPPLPWVASWLTPYAVQTDGAVVQALTQVPRVLAWGLIGGGT